MLEDKAALLDVAPVGFAGSVQLPRGTQVRVNLLSAASVERDEQSVIYRTTAAEMAQSGHRQAAQRRF